MQIQLKQHEIVIALKHYISAHGINLTGKDVSITFTAGRKESGITADIAIEEMAIPGFTANDADGGGGAGHDEGRPTLTVVPNHPVQDDAPPAVQETPNPAPASPAPLAPAIAAAPVDAQAPLQRATTSLFG